ncbi:hypothetical protein CBF23_002255 [Marinomonas agarivorans]|nr:hypothetical protein CBF23_002255 [Marinomonas agarivorans]
MGLRFFFGVHEQVCVGNQGYPITWEKWREYWYEEDYRSICMIDLPIIKDEILKNYEALLAGDFSFDSEFVKWDKWYEQQEGKTSKELTYEYYKSLNVR